MNLMGIVGLGAAIDLLFEVGIEKIADRVRGLGDRIIKEAESRKFSVLTPRERDRRGGNITFSGKFDPGSARDRLRDEGIMVNVRAGGLRVSPHFYNTVGELDRFFTLLDRVI